MNKGNTPPAVRHFVEFKGGPCLRCGMTAENMVKRHRKSLCRGSNKDPKTGQAYPPTPALPRLSFSDIISGGQP